jgi:cell surface protein SprA
MRYSKLNANDPGEFLFHENPNEVGTFNISTFTFFRSFQDGTDPVNSKLFSDFKDERANIANELGDQNPESKKRIPMTGGVPGNYVDGYSENQQDVLVGAFYRSYTGRSIKDYNTRNIFPTIPLPNWNVTLDGLGKLKFIKKYF